MMLDWASRKLFIVSFNSIDFLSSLGIVQVSLALPSFLRKFNYQLSIVNYQLSIYRHANNIKGVDGTSLQVCF